MTERRTVTLSEPAAQALFWLAGEDDCSLTEAHNRTLVAHAGIRRLLKDGSELAIVRSDGEVQKIILI